MTIAHEDNLSEGITTDISEMEIKFPLFIRILYIFFQYYQPRKHNVRLMGWPRLKEVLVT